MDDILRKNRHWRVPPQRGELDELTNKVLDSLYDMAYAHGASLSSKKLAFAGIDVTGKALEVLHEAAADSYEAEHPEEYELGE